MGAATGAHRVPRPRRPRRRREWALTRTAIPRWDTGARTLLYRVDLADGDRCGAGRARGRPRVAPPRPAAERRCRTELRRRQDGARLRPGSRHAVVGERRFQPRQHRDLSLPHRASRAAEPLRPAFACRATSAISRPATARPGWRIRPGPKVRRTAQQIDEVLSSRALYVTTRATPELIGEIRRHMLEETQHHAATGPRAGAGAGRGAVSLEARLAELAERGYTVVPGALSEEEVAATRLVPPASCWTPRRRWRAAPERRPTICATATPSSASTRTSTSSISTRR